MHHPTGRIAHTRVFLVCFFTLIDEHWLKRGLPAAQKFNALKFVSTINNQTLVITCNKYSVSFILSLFHFEFPSILPFLYPLISFGCVVLCRRRHHHHNHHHLLHNHHHHNNNHNNHNHHHNHNHNNHHHYHHHHNNNHHHHNHHHHYYHHYYYYWGPLNRFFYQPLTTDNLPIAPPRSTRKEGNVLFNDALNTFYLRFYGVRHIYGKGPFR